MINGFSKRFTYSLSGSHRNSGSWKIGIHDRLPLRLTPEMTQELIYSVMNEDQIAEFEKEKNWICLFGVERLSRFA
jgi:hypothetical protein